MNSGSHFPYSEENLLRQIPASIGATAGTKEGASNQVKTESLNRSYSGSPNSRADGSFHSLANYERG